MITACITKTNTISSAFLILFLIFISSTSVFAQNSTNNKQNTVEGFALATGTLEAEKAKEAARKKKEEDEKKLEEKKKREEAEKAAAAKKAEQERKAHEAKKIKELREAAQKALKEEEARKLQEARKAEEKRIAAEKAKKAEEARKLEAARKAAAAEIAKKKAEERKKAAAKKRAEAASKKEAKKWIKKWGSKVYKATKKESKKERKKRQLALKKVSHDHQLEFFESERYLRWKAIYAGTHIGRSALDGDGGGTIGIFAGKNWQKDKVVYGIEAELSSLNNESSATDLQTTLSVNADWLAAIKLRVGYLVAPDTLLYATAGVAWANFDTEIKTAGQSVRSSDTLNGFLVGIGAEHKFDNNWSARLEYAYTSFDEQNVDIGRESLTYDPDIHAIRIAFVYKF